MSCRTWEKRETRAIITVEASYAVVRPDDPSSSDDAISVSSLGCKCNRGEGEEVDGIDGDDLFVLISNCRADHEFRRKRKREAKGIDRSM